MLFSVAVFVTKGPCSLSIGDQLLPAAKKLSNMWGHKTQVKMSLVLFLLRYFSVKICFKKGEGGVLALAII